MASTRRERLYQALYDSQRDLGEVAKGEHMSLSHLADWANESDTIGALEGLCRLNDARAQMLVSRYRTLAAARLFELAKSDEGGELARRACVDLLKVSLEMGQADAAANGPGPTGLDDATARQLFTLAGTSRAGDEDETPAGSEDGA
jgi:hypothetical protein